MKEAIIIFGCSSRIGQNFINQMHNDFKILCNNFLKKKEYIRTLI
jgi:hypothetical protein